MSVASEFLKMVWGHQPQGHRFLATKDWASGAWKDHEVKHGAKPGVEDLYFAVNVFAEPTRREQFMLPGAWLYADLDEVEPRGDFPEPTAAWETSPGKYQALWCLSARLKPATLLPLNQTLTYCCGADKGGWGSTKVLRVPGTYNNKYEGQRFKVELLWDDGPRYAPSDVLRAVKGTETPQIKAAKLPDLVLPKVDANRLYRRHRQKLSLEARKLVRATETGGADRSEVLWKLERLLIESGVPPNQTFVMVKASVWNKYRGQRREDQQLWREVQKAAGNAKPSETKQQKRSSGSSGNTRRLIAFDDFVSQETHKPMWMVEGIWSESAHGVLAGEPKTYKSVISSDLAISVASGTPFLNHFPVPQTGPVIMIQKENDEAEVQDRIMRIAHSKTLTGQAQVRAGTLNYTPHADLPAYFMNNEDFDLTDESDIRWLRKKVRKHNPVLVVLDPLYLLAPGVDENSAHEMTPILERLLRIKQTYNCGTLLVHHYKKQDNQKPMSGPQRISGTGVFHRWFESALLLERPDREDALVKMTPDHRGHKPSGSIWAEFDLGTEHDLHYGVDVSRKKVEVDGTSDVLQEALQSKDGILTIGELATLWGTSPNGAKRKVGQLGGEVVLGRANGRKQGIVKLPE